MNHGSRVNGSSPTQTSRFTGETDGRPSSSDRKVEYVEHFTKRLLTDCLTEATKTWWLKRAADFENARPRIGDFHGKATLDQLRTRWHELTRIANACRARAQVAPLDEIDPDVERVWGEAS